MRVRLKPFRATRFAELERGLARLPWHAYLRVHAAPRISVTCHKSRLYHSDAVAARVRRVLQERLGSAEGEHVSWLTIANQEQSVLEDVQRIRNHPLVPKDIPIYGYIFDVKSGSLVEVPEATAAGRAG